MDNRHVNEASHSIAPASRSQVVTDDQCNQQNADRPSAAANRGISEEGQHCFLPDNQEVLKPQPSSNSRHVYRYEKCESIVIPVEGTLSRPLKRPVRRWNADEDNKATVKARNALMYLNEKLCDVYFVVGNNQDRERIPAHSYVLAIASSPFDAMFNGGFERMSEIVIPDIEPAAFKILLRYLYTDEIELTTDLALPTLYAANKYLILYLARACICFLEENLDSANVCQILSQSRLFENEDLVSRCWEIIDINAEKVLRSEGFRNIDFNLFESIIMRDSLIVKERILYEAAVEWAESECARQGKPIVSKNIRDALGDALYFIRFPAMTINEFANGPARSGLLTCLETNNIFLYFTAEEKPQLPFPTMPRSGFSLSICSRFQTTLRGTNQWRYRGRRDSIQFCVDRRIFVAGYGLYGSSNGASEYKVRMELKRNDHILEGLDTTYLSNGTSDVFHIHFKHPVQIEADFIYIASVLIEGKDLSHYGQEGMAEVSVQIKDCCGVIRDIVNFFFMPSADSKNGTGVQGGQIPEIIFYA